jgi:hypothetical protein
MNFYTEPRAAPPPESGWKAFGKIVAALLLIPVLLYVLQIVGFNVIGFVAVITHDFVNSGSSTGDEAFRRAEREIRIDFGDAHRFATNARAYWTADDFHGDNTEYFAFNLPVEQLPAFEGRIRTAWSADPTFEGPGKVAEVVPSGDGPEWYRESVKGSVFYRVNTGSIGINRATGRVIIYRFDL